MARYISKGAKMKCSYGSSPSFLSVENRGGKEGDEFPAYKEDSKPFTNITSFGTCNKDSSKPVPCTVPISMEWQKTENGTEYRKLTKEYDAAAKDVNNAINKLKSKGQIFQNEVERTAENYEKDIEKNIVKHGADKRQKIPFPTAYYRDIRGLLNQYGTNEQKVLDLGAQSPAKPKDDAGKMLFGYQAYFEKLYDTYNKLVVEWKNATGKLVLNYKGFLDNTPNKYQEVLAEYQKAVGCYNQMRAIEQTLIPANAKERLTMDSVVYCTKGGAIEFQTPKTKSKYDTENLIEKEIGIYNTSRFFWRGVTVRFFTGGAEAKEMNAQLDPETNLHYFMHMDDVEYMAVALGLCLPELYDEQIGDMFAHTSIQTMLETASVDLGVNYQESGYWNLSIAPAKTEERVNDAMETFWNSAEVVALLAAQELLAVKDKEAYYPFDVRLPMIPVPGGFMQAGVGGKVNVFAMHSLVAEGLVNLLAGYVPAIQRHVTGTKFEFNLDEDGSMSSVGIRLTYRKEDKVLADQTSLELEESKTNEEDVIIFQAGTGVLYTKTPEGSVKVTSKDGKTETTVMTNSGIGVAMEGSIPGFAFSIKTGILEYSLSVKVFYYPNFIKIACRATRTLPFEVNTKPVGTFEPYVDLYLLRGFSPPERVSEKMPQAHQAWAEVLTYEQFADIQTVTDLEFQLQRKMDEFNGYVNKQGFVIVLVMVALMGVLFVAPYAPGALPAASAAIKGAASKLLPAAGAAIKGAASQLLPQLAGYGLNTAVAAGFSPYQKLLLKH